MNKKQTSSQFLKFLTVGISNTIISYLVFALCASVLNLNIFLSQCLSYSAGIAWSYALNSKWTFNSTSLSFTGFAGFQIAQLLLSAFLIHHFSQSYHPHLVWLVIMAIMTLINFFGLKLLFSRPRK